MSDLHTALKTAEEGSASGGGVNFVAVRLVSAKDSSILSLHAAPMSFSTAGVQRTDLLSELGLVRSRCPFMPGGECYVIRVADEFDVSTFAATFANDFEAYRAADQQLERCGFRLNQPEGFGFFFGKTSQPSGMSRTGGGDGHTASKVELLKQSSDASFDFAFTWVDSPGHKGWTTHYRPKHPPLSSETLAAFQYLGLSEFATCPEFEFEHCHWRLDAFTEGRPFLANEVHGLFDAHSEAFSLGIAELLRVQSLVRPFGLGFLASVDQVQPLPAEVLPQPSTKVATTRQGAKPSGSYEYDVALSFAGTERQVASELAQAIADRGYRVFYDDFYPEHLWGKDLPVFFDDVYRKRSRFCIIFVSQEYASRMWTTHERRSAQARALEERGREYILPIRVDETDLPGMPPTIGYVSLHDHSMDQIAGMLVAKLSSN